VSFYSVKTCGRSGRASQQADSYIREASRIIMVRLFASVLLLAMLPSCASIISRRSYPMSVRSNAGEAHIRYKDSTYALPAILKVRRANTALALDFITADTLRHIMLHPQLSPAFVVGNLGWMPAAPAAYLIDLASPKRFTYGRNLFLNTADTSGVYPASRRRWQHYWARSYAPQKGDVSLTLGLPLLSNFLFRPEAEPMKNTSGFLGLQAGLGYAFRDKHSIVLAGGIAMDYPLPFPAAVDYSGFFERSRAAWVGLTELHHFRRLAFGYGLAYTHNSWTLDYDADRSGLPQPAGYPLVKSRNGLGIMATGYFRLNRLCRLGLQYRSSLLDLDKGSPGPYEQVISLELAFPFKLLGGC
jgi:hypothetical protein